MAGERPFGVVLRALRQQARMTIEDLSEASGVSVRAIGNMERGQSLVPQRRTVVALVEGLGLGESERELLLAASRAGRPTRAVALAGAAVPLRSVRDFTGRAPHLAWLAGAAERVDEGVSVAVISGPPGCGKTTLAFKAAADLAGAFPDGRFVVDLHGVDGAVEAGEGLVKLLKALGVTDRRLRQEGAAGHAGLLRALLGERRCLVVLDNARDEEQVRPLLPAAGRSLVLVTSRRPLSGLEDVDRLALAEMEQGEAVELLGRILGEGRADAEPEAVARVAQMCGRLPLALRVAGNWLAVRPAWSVERLVGRLSDEGRRLRALSAGDARVEAAFELSYRQLSAEAARMLRLLSLVPGPDMTVEYGACSAEVDVFEAEDVMEELVESGLLQATSDGRYRLHDLVRLFARARLALEETSEEREAAESRLRAWLLGTAVVAGRWYKPAYGAPPPSWRGLVPLRNAEEAREWLRSEAPSWLAALRAAAEKGEHGRVVEVGDAMEWFCDLWVFWGHWSEVYEVTGRSAAALGDPDIQAFHLNMHAWALIECDHRYREAVERAEAGLYHARLVGDVAQQASALSHAAVAHRKLGEGEEAADKARASVELYEGTDDREGWLGAMVTWGSCLRSLGRVAEAHAQHLRIVAFLDAPDRPVGEHLAGMVRAHTAYALGLDHALLGRWDDAVECHRDALARFRSVGMPHMQASALLGMGEAMIELGRGEEARGLLDEVVEFGDAADGAIVSGARKLLASLPGPFTDPGPGPGPGPRRPGVQVGGRGGAGAGSGVSRL
ncbi:helix-turn-helix domain-containing protein [Streptomyces sp. NPDC047130]|uniref:ATP-binding protein n=1 Tax=Streptomyces sp. NPDC047130 TaxID=3155261 RepID=UPI0033E6844D